MQKGFLEALAVLRAGGVIAHATETCYGFACDSTNRSALARLYRIKKMSHSKPVSILVWSLEEAEKYGIFSVAAKKLAKKYWPGPLTLIVKRKKTLPVFLNPGHKTVGIRVPAHALSRKLAQKLGRPITTTSANISSMPSPYSVYAIRRQFRGQKLKPDFILDSGRLSKNSPSTILDVTGKKPKIIRQGGLKISI